MISRPYLMKLSVFSPRLFFLPWKAISRVTFTQSSACSILFRRNNTWTRNTYHAIWNSSKHRDNPVTVGISRPTLYSPLSATLGQLGHCSTAEDLPARIELAHKVGLRYMQEVCACTLRWRPMHRRGSSLAGGIGPTQPLWICRDRRPLTLWPGDSVDMRICSWEGSLTWNEC